MKKISVVLILTLAAGLLGTSVLPATSQEPSERTTITLFDPNKTDYEKHVRGSAEPFRPGDWHVYVDRLLDPDKCEVAAKVVGRFVFVKRIGKFNGWLINDMTVTLSGGRITGYGAAKFSDFAKDEPTFAVTGGTGAYKDASGQIQFATEVEERCGTKGMLSTVDVGPTS